MPLGRTRNLYLPAVVLGIALILLTTEAVTVPVGFFAAAIVMLALQLLTPKEAYEAVEWPVLVLIGVLIPVSEALQTTGATALIASWLSAAAQQLPPLGALGMTAKSAKHARNASMPPSLQPGRQDPKHLSIQEI